MKILLNLQANKPSESYFRQQDAPEILLVLFDYLIAEYQIRFPHMTCPVIRMFSGEFERCVSCSNCAYTSKTKQQFGALEITTEADSITASLHQFFQPETLSDFRCSCNNADSVITSCSRISKVPSVLTLQLKRFVHADNKKIVKSMTIAKKLQLGEGTYQFASAIVHLGDKQSEGHYLALAANTQNGVTIYNDHLIYKPTVNDFAVVKENSYILMKLIVKC